MRSLPLKRCFSFVWSISAKELLMVSRKEDSTSFSLHCSCQVRVIIAFYCLR